MSPVCEHSPAEDLVLIEAAAREAGALGRTAFEASSAKVWDKGGGHPVTDADIAVNDRLNAILRAARPDYGWLSEETVDDASRHACPRSFVVDPIDGTRAFIDGRAGWTVCVGVIEGGQPVAGAVYDVVRDRMYAASLGAGATVNGKPVRVTDRDCVKGIRMVGYPRKFRRAGWPDMNVSISNSMAGRMVRAASGAADATVSFTGKSDWDVAAADIFAREAGAVVTDLYGESLRYDGKSVRQNGIICAGPTLHGLLRDLVRANPDPNSPLLKTLPSDRDPDMSAKAVEPVQLLHLVIGGELHDPNKTAFRDLSKVEMEGAYPNFAEAHAAWKNAAQRTVDNAHMRYFIIHAHELLDPDNDGVIG